MSKQRGIHLDDPWLEVLVEQHVEAVQLEAVLVIDDDALYTLQTLDENLVHLRGPVARGISGVSRASLRGCYVIILFLL